MGAWTDDFRNDAQPLRPYKLPVNVTSHQCSAFRDRQIVWSSRLNMGGVDHLPSAAELDTFYSQEYRLIMNKPTGLQNYLNSPGYLASSKSIVDWVADANLADITNWMDIGAGYGLLLHEARKRFKHTRLTAVEPSSMARSDLQGVCDQLIDSFDFLTKFDGERASSMMTVITLIHVLEHLSEPETVLQTLKNWLNPDGVLIIEVPNDNIDEMKSPERRSDLPHLWFFSKCGLNDLLTHSGFTVRRITEIGVVRPPARVHFLTRVQRFLLRKIYGVTFFTHDKEFYRETPGRSSIRILAQRAF